MGPVLLRGNFPACTGFLKLFRYPRGSFGDFWGVGGVRILNVLKHSLQTRRQSALVTVTGISPKTF